MIHSFLQKAKQRDRGARRDRHPAPYRRPDEANLGAAETISRGRLAFGEKPRQTLFQQD
ncbi:hypothetical protein OVY29_16200 [Sphingopyxis sp. SE2]|jgi:hypothetical protein|uniref:hypothetical protein n=1 Tax=unclassified Sphingopyxis TaxID=2614943 RepID=UPI001377C1BE|nr:MULTISPECIES: hypothetical protein [unclassified Sphingopyxis]MDT7530201.1 hypothetical protein [Sphingopyxis sp. SE2]